MIIHQHHNSVKNSYNKYTYANCNWYLHFHKNLEIAYVISGSVTVTVDNVRKKLTGGMFVFILPNQIHSYYTDTDKESKVFIVVFSEDYVHGFIKKIGSKTSDTPYFLCDKYILDYFNETIVKPDECSSFMLKSALYAICDQYMTKCRPSERQIAGAELMQSIIEYISEHYKEDLNLQKVAAAVGYEYHYISRFFGDSFHTNFRELLNEYRIANAKELLESTDKTIGDISEEVGFNNTRTFGRAFKKITGISPKNYR